jgi:hypothetical protein
MSLPKKSLLSHVLDDSWLFTCIHENCDFSKQPGKQPKDNQAFPSISFIVRHAVDDIPGAPNTSHLHLGVLCSSSAGAHGMLSVSFWIFNKRCCSISSSFWDEHQIQSGWVDSQTPTPIYSKSQFSRLMLISEFQRFTNTALHIFTGSTFNEA